MSDLGERRGLRSSACPGGIAAPSGCIFVVGWSFRGGRSGGCVCPGGGGGGGGRRASKRRVSRRMPRKVRAVVGPSVFSVAMGTPRYAQTARRISNRCWQMVDAGGPAVR